MTPSGPTVSFVFETIMASVSFLDADLFISSQFNFVCMLLVICPFIFSFPIP